MTWADLNESDCFHIGCERRKVGTTLKKTAIKHVKLEIEIEIEIGNWTGRRDNFAH